MITRQARLVVAWMGTSGLFLNLGLRAAHAEAPPQTKAPEVSTVGTEPYVGPLPGELLKLTLVEASSQAPAPTGKEPDVSTILSGVPGAPTEEALAKLAAYLATPVTLPLPEMPKLDPMAVPTDGTPALTPQELEKRASELAARRASQSPNSGTAPKSAR